MINNTENKKNTLLAKDIVKSFSKRIVVDKVSLTVNSGEIVGLLGPNGAGKTTSFYMIVGLIKKDSGKIYLNKEDISDVPMYRRARMGISYLPQEASVFRKLTVKENIMLVLENMKLTNRERLKKAYILMEDLGILKLAKSKAYTLSGGERRRVEIARALATDPKFILLDEPFSGIDPIAVADIQEIIKKLIKKNIGVLITDHNVRETLGICNRAYIMGEGKVKVEGSPEEIVNDPIAIKSYLGEDFNL